MGSYRLDPIDPKRIVIKLGTGILKDDTGGVCSTRVEQIAQTVQGLRDKKIDVIIVSSGAIGLGMGEMGFVDRPNDLATLQACASVGQSLLTEKWRGALHPKGIVVAQLLLTRDDLRGERRHIAVRNTLDKLLSEGIVPIVNENDAISYEEIRFGDNDVLSAMLAKLTGADLLSILSTIPGFMKDLDAGEVIHYIDEITQDLMDKAGGPGSKTSVGGMVTKLEAAKIATEAGCATFIGSGFEQGVLDRLLQGECEGTYFVAKT